MYLSKLLAESRMKRKTANGSHLIPCLDMDLLFNYTSQNSHIPQIYTLRNMVAQLCIVRAGKQLK